MSIESRGWFSAADAYRYFGGPWDGRSVELMAGWPPPDAMEHEEWPDGHYRRDDASMRYVWRGVRWRARSSGM